MGSKRKRNNRNNSNTVKSKTNTANIIDEDVQNRIDRCFNVYNLVNGWIEKTDNKVNISIAISSVVIGLITLISQTFKLESLTVESNYIALNLIYLFTFVLSIIIWLISVVYHLIIICPNLTSNANKKRNKKENKEDMKVYPIFFKDIANTNSDKYMELMLAGRDKDLLEEIIADTHQNSIICKDKMERFSFGVKLSLLSFVFAFISLVIHLLYFCLAK